MFAMIVGSVPALIFIGLPVAIIGLFILSILDRRNKRPVEGYKALRRAGSESEGAAPHRPSRLAVHAARYAFEHQHQAQSNRRLGRIGTVRRRLEFGRHFLPRRLRPMLRWQMTDQPAHVGELAGVITSGVTKGRGRRRGHRPRYCPQLGCGIA